ncbi:MAG: hypothetical protein H7333_03550 [Bdellovibrionales bacterium]|nr:hypothetical protein [Oligoflexia bacterium]
MRTLLALSLLLSSFDQTPAQASRGRDCSVDGGFGVTCFTPREKTELRVALVYYGSFWTSADLIRFEAFLQKRFLETTSGAISMKVVASHLLPFKTQMPASYTYNHITDRDRLQRIWYWQNVNTGVGQEIYYEYENSSATSTDEGVDVIVAVSGAQWDGNGFSAGTVAAVEQPREIAWGLEDGGSTEVLSDAQLADSLIHELGHSLSLGHSNDQCKESMDVKEYEACCAKSPAKNDIMGYCRDRSPKHVNETTFNKFEACTLDILRSRVLPSLLKGGNRRIPELLHCD